MSAKIKVLIVVIVIVIAGTVFIAGLLNKNSKIPNTVLRSELEVGHKDKEHNITYKLVSGEEPQEFMVQLGWNFQIEVITPDIEWTVVTNGVTDTPIHKLPINHPFYERGTYLGVIRTVSVSVPRYKKAIVAFRLF
ncbi:MAG: hypothetical protein M3Q80_03065 [bacterium]|nr:hypothetical protein [bacterium]